MCSIHTYCIRWLVQILDMNYHYITTCLFHTHTHTHDYHPNEWITKVLYMNWFCFITHRYRERHYSIKSSEKKIIFLHPNTSTHTQIEILFGHMNLHDHHSYHQQSTTKKNYQEFFPNDFLSRFIIVILIIIIIVIVIV